MSSPTRCQSPRTASASDRWRAGFSIRATRAGGAISTTELTPLMMFLNMRVIALLAPLNRQIIAYVSALSKLLISPVR